ncbi:hypothetical protein SAMN05428967_3261 [Phyllobacterium sp. YR620]|uniref:hypothetical protein n=1 Tax=Phyllobacterium TaxID=28100 RepID=UPI0004823F43|nr:MULTISPECIES: hypothetical protein [unclassified Phyllobacterium]MRG55936.1 hypothetical protein [Phyllobacterium sp. SYP-B3895]UGY11118.1 hypothetical protein LLE51_008155 [Phyllobacterium sp. T1018]SDP73156.1 hypothetical protein SAMN05428967_3261 [Phyllobacterium sp. YR620]
MDELEELLARLTAAQRQLITSSAKTKTFPDNNTLQKIATLALNISSVETMIVETQGRAQLARLAKAND